MLYAIAMGQIKMDINKSEKEVVRACAFLDGNLADDLERPRPPHVTPVYFALDMGAKYFDQRASVRLSVCLSARISQKTRPNLTEFSIHVTCDRDSDLI